MSWHDVAAASDVETGRVSVVEVNGTRIALCRAESGVYAIEDVCSHDGAPLDQGELLGEQIECPRHGARFDVTTGKNLSLPAVRPVKSYPAREHDGRIEIDLS
jgi:3-phenylpropionate/trans-cinnamate dioxygenase ferredoxin component